MIRKTMAQKKEELLQDPVFKQEYDALEESFNLARALMHARVAAHLTQEQVAARMQTKQSVVARLESGRSMPSLRTLHKYAEATGTRLRISFESLA
jgi:ribosome-binding protein aMBF1 (putative translation factor)